MSAPKRPHPAVLLIGGLVLLNVLLVAVLVLRQSGDASSVSSASAVPASPSQAPTGATSKPTPSGGSSSQTSPGPTTPSETPSVPDNQTTDASPRDASLRVMTVSSATVAWRAETEPCGWVGNRVIVR